MWRIQTYYYNHPLLIHSFFSQNSFKECEILCVLIYCLFWNDEGLGFSKAAITSQTQTCFAHLSSIRSSCNNHCSCCLSTQRKDWWWQGVNGKLSLHLKLLAMRERSPFCLSDLCVFVCLCEWVYSIHWDERYYIHTIHLYNTSIPLYVLVWHQTEH